MTMLFCIAESQIKVIHTYIQYVSNLWLVHLSIRFELSCLAESENRRPSLCSRNKTRSNLEPLREAPLVTDFSNEFELDDEAAWVSGGKLHG